MSTRLSADERRDEVIAAAILEFAVGGFAGTSSGSIARRAGVSQPYLFQLFGTKQELVLAVVRNCFRRTTLRFEAAARTARAAGLDSNGVLGQMGDSYFEMLLADRDLLRVQLHAYAACGDPEVRAVVREEWLTLWQTVARISGSEPSALYSWFATGMLFNVIASIGEAGTLEEFNTLLHGVADPTGARSQATQEGRDLPMFHLTTLTDHRIRDLQRTAAELRAQPARSDATAWRNAFRLRVGTILLATGNALLRERHAAGIAPADPLFSAANLVTT